jgi:sortase B
MQKKKNIPQIIRKILLVISVLIFAFGLTILITYYIQSYLNKQKYNQIRQIHSSAVSASSDASSASSDTENDFSELLKQNSEFKGWITIPNTNIDYPVVQASDNSKYLKTGFDGKANRDGSIFLDYRNKIDPLSQNTIIYGHNMKDGQMFQELEKYERRDGNDYVSFYNSSPLIAFNTLKESTKWKIFAVFVTTADSKYKNSLYYLDTEFNTDEDFNTFISEVCKRSFINTSVDVKPTDNLLTLSTCDYYYPATDDGEHARLVVMARMVRKGESTSVAAATKNDNVLFPDYYIRYWKNH